MVLIILRRGINFVEIYLLRRLKVNNICCEYFHKSEKNYITNTILRSNEKEHSETTVDSNKYKEVIVDNPKKRELPEEPTTCCMSGCANCVWLEYAEKLSEYFKDGGEKAIQEINEKVNDPNIKAFLLQELRMKKLN